MVAFGTTFPLPHEPAKVRNPHPQPPVLISCLRTRQTSSQHSLSITASHKPRITPQKRAFFGDDSGVPKLLNTVEKLAQQRRLSRIRKQ
jgi:hypothetical protein